ncbi:helix-turn-helix transcriptional regulator [Mycobacterium sp.]|uniref:helix-turn-helix domain-containing protein n=1 Tax=Mycobacterium sp. TaxID=1785 RepID=UPI002BA5E808|nr:helix-turn-helix transcriptional regulator [Mycobacterium sp.]HTQ22421.1 helix-turn-helix transcriptional regulator [Mycobacterium sp.]
MSPLRFRNIAATPDDPVEQWGVEGVLAAIDRGSLPHWRRIAAAVRADPYGSVAADLEQALTVANDTGVVATLRRTLAQVRRDCESAARAEVRRRLGELVGRSGLTAAQFAQRLGTSASRMSTYLTGKVVPSAAVLVRSEMVCEMAVAEQKDTASPTDAVT